MRWIKVSLLRTATVLVFCGMFVVMPVGKAMAESAPNPSLIISQLKITSSNGQFVTLYNTTSATLDMSKYQLGYFNSYDLTKATSSRLIALSGYLPPHSYYMVNDSALLLCYQMSVDSVSLGFSSTAGMVEVIALNQTSVGGSVVSAMQDYVGWSKTATAGAQTLPSSVNAFLQRQPLDASGKPKITSAGEGSWIQVQPDGNNPCNVVTYSTNPIPINIGLNQLLPSTEPPVIIVDQPVDAVSAPVFPSADIGLKAPTISELLPNPSGSGNDSVDEYIELYNPNDTSFDLSGFVLQSGTTTLRKYTFPSNTLLSPNSFTAFYSETTGLNLSNNGGLVKLLDPFGNSISATAQYGSAKDGNSWALANGKWSWSSQPTPNASNIIKAIATTKNKKATKSKSLTSKGKVKAASKTKKLQTAKLTSSYSEPPAQAAVKIWTIAIVGLLALLYACYEYRTDLSNIVFKFRRHLKDRRGVRP
ncbi:MAG: lamin tail domain-containing protein [bacterium]